MFVLITRKKMQQLIRRSGQSGEVLFFGLGEGGGYSLCIAICGGGTHFMSDRNEDCFVNDVCKTQYPFVPTSAHPEVIDHWAAAILNDFDTSKQPTRASSKMLAGVNLDGACKRGVVVVRRRDPCQSGLPGWREY